MTLQTFHVGVKGILCTEGKCLLLKRQKSDVTYWDFPGGRMEVGESPGQALEREMREELPSLNSYTIDGLLDAYPLPTDVAYDGAGLMFLFYKISAEPFEVALSSEHTEFRWVTKSEAEELSNDDTFKVRYPALMRAYGQEN